jgi:hypothetical protein
MNNYNITPINKKRLGDSITKTTINITYKNGTSLTFQDISAIVDQLNKDMTNPKYSSKFIVIASTPFNKNFNLKSYNQTNVSYNSIDDYLDGRVRDTTKFSVIQQISITMIKELR